MVVIDTSIVGPLVLADEPALSDPTAEAIVRGPLAAPAHWPLEVMSMLHAAARRGRLDPAGRHRAARRVRDMAVAVQPDTGDFAWTDISRLADLHGLTVYDAAYLELALRLDASLATRDGDLTTAARTEGVRVLD